MIRIFLGLVLVRPAGEDLSHEEREEAERADKQAAAETHSAHDGTTKQTGYGLC